MSIGKIYSFRARIALLLILTLVMTTAVLYKLNQRAERSVIEEVDRQRRDLAEAINIAQQSLSSKQWLRDFLKTQRSQGQHESHVERILVVNLKGIVEDSSDKDDIEKRFDELGFGAFIQTNDLEIDHAQEPNKPSSTVQYQMYKFPVETNTGKVNLIIIFSPEDLNEQLKTSSEYRLLATGGVLFVSILISLILILEFTRPVGTLVEAAKRVAAGEFDVRLSTKRRDELGHLMAVFNELAEVILQLVFRAERTHRLLSSFGFSAWCGSPTR